jgi:hypothetical protein
MRIEKLHIHFGEDVAHNPALVVFGDIRQLRPGQSMVQIYKKKRSQGNQLRVLQIGIQIGSEFHAQYFIV